MYTFVPKVPFLKSVILSDSPDKPKQKLIIITN